MFRTELRFDYNIDGNRERGDKFGTVTANGYLDLPLDFPIKPYVGAGIGYGFASTIQEDVNGLAVALMGGLTFDASPSVAIDVGYRYRTVAHDGIVFANDDVQDHAVTAGLRYRF